MAKDNQIDWQEVRINASISCLNSLIETTQHSVVECIAIKDLYAKTAVMYADALINALKKAPWKLEEEIKESLKEQKSQLSTTEVVDS